MGHLNRSLGVTNISTIMTISQHSILVTFYFILPSLYLVKEPSRVNRYYWVVRAAGSARDRAERHCGVVGFISSPSFPKHDLELDRLFQTSATERRRSEEVSLPFGSPVFNTRLKDLVNMTEDQDLMAKISQLAGTRIMECRYTVQN